MELDDLKQAWQQTPVQKQNTNIMELIHHKSYGPLAALKRAFKRQMRLMLLLPVILLLTNTANLQAALTSVLFWSYTAFCLGVVAFSGYNYRIVGQMETLEGRVRPALEQYIHTLETRLRWMQVGLRLVLLYFVVLLEVVPYFQHYRMLDKWHSLDPLIRFGSYAALLGLQYVLSRRMCRIKFGNHLAHLKELVRELQ